MGFSYNPLFKLLLDRGMKRTDLIKEVGIGPTTLSKMGKGEYVAMEVLDRMCTHFDVQLHEVVEHVKDQRED